MRNLLLAVAVTALVLMLPQKGGAAVEGPPEVYITCLWFTNGELTPDVWGPLHPRQMASMKRLCTGVLGGEVINVEFVRS